MTELLTSAQMRAIEAAAIASGQVTGLELMERAGRGVVEAIFAEWPALAGGSFRAVVLCGPGNNGGDGFVVARLLKEWGWEVEVFLYGDAARMPPDARANYERWCGIGEVENLEAAVQKMTALVPKLVIDALFGTGLTREPDLILKRVFREVHTCRFGWGIEAKVVAVDVPSGLCSDSGRVIGQSDEYEYAAGDQTGFPLEDSIDADLTVTFYRRKIGHFLADGPDRTGILREITLGPELRAFHWPSLAKVKRLPLRPVRMDLATVRTDEPVGTVDLPKRSTEHKYSHGHALILSGAPGHGGAARLAARGALRIGAGLVTVGCGPEALAENAARLDAVMLREVADGAALRVMLEDRRINALCIGPGLGVARAAEMLAVVLGEGPGAETGAAPRALVIDADGLTALAGDAGLFGRLHGDCVLIPHGGEFARLFPDIAAKLDAPATKGPAYSKVDATREAAARAGSVVLFKGADTVIADPAGRCSVNSAHFERAAPWLATAGSGDVLAGFIAGLMARGFGAMQAAETGAWLHVECARAFGPGLIAEDLADQLPGVFRSLGL